ncbi:MAG: hypothetical protein P8N02_14700, partial [Actinomycetota bacterium]|nr:hypothetical protein [Actinomycetota bacterium]
VGDHDDRGHAVNRAAHSTAPGAWDGRSKGLLGQVQNALNLHLPLKSPGQMHALAQVLKAHSDAFHEGVLGLR